MEATRWGFPVSPVGERTRTASAPRRTTTITTTTNTTSTLTTTTSTSQPTQLESRTQPSAPRTRYHRKSGSGASRRSTTRSTAGWSIARTVLAWISWLAVLVQQWAADVYHLCSTSRRRRPPSTIPTRDILIEELQRAEDGVPRLASVDTIIAGSAAAVAETIRIRSTRASSTSAAARRAVRTVREFVQANPTLAAGSSGEPTHDHYDIIMEAFILTECAHATGTRSPWTRARRKQDPSAARGAGAARALLERLQWSRGGAWSRSRNTEKAFDMRSDARHTNPIFTWELIEGLRLRTPRTPWEMAGAALVTIGSLHAKRGGGAKKLKVGDVSVAAHNAIEVSSKRKDKGRTRASGAASGKDPPVVLRHWLVARHVVPWLQWHEEQRSPKSALLFPAITSRKSPKPTSLGFTAEAGQWVEPMRQWSPRAVEAWLVTFIPNLGGRRFHGLRAGNNRELRRHGDVHTITRRSLHGRSLKQVIGSESHYDEPFAEDFASATERLGRLRIERSRTGLLTITATSASAGERNDWVAEANPIALAETPDSDTSSSDSDEDDTSTDGEECVGDGGRATRAYRCGRCKTLVRPTDYGFMCDVDSCNWGTCTDCHPGGAATALRCPQHE